MANLTLTPSTNSIIASVTGLSSAHSRVRYFYWNIDGEYYKTTTLAAYGSSHSTTLSGLEPGTEYYISVDICEAPSYNNGQLLASLSGSAATTVNVSFGWTYAGLHPTTGAAVLSSNGYKRQGYGVYITAAEWNEMLACIDAICGTSLETDSRTRAVRGANLTADMYNNVAYVLAYMGMASLSPVTAGVTNISASHLNALVDAINSY